MDDNHLEVLLEKDTQTTVQKLVDEMNVSVGSIWNHLRANGKVKKVPHEMNKNQKNYPYEICSVLLLRNEAEPFVDRIVT